MRRSVKRLLGVLLATGLIGGCAAGQAWPSSAERQKPPYAEGVEVGTEYDYVLLTHCGVVQAQIDGTMWEADPPQVAGGGNPPQGWGNLWTGGTLRLLSHDEAEFVDGDNRARFRRADAPPRACN